MAYNKAREEKKWRLWKEAEEKQLRSLGVSENDIEKLRVHDWAIFNSDRRYYQRVQETGTYLDELAEDTTQPEVKTVEDFLDSILDDSDIIDSSEGIALLHMEEEHDHGHEDHHHEDDPHIWLSPENAKIMARNICLGLTEQYPQWETVFSRNLEDLLARLDALEQYGQTQLRDLSCRELITFHDGFAYFAQAFDLEILAAVEEESGSEASAKELISLITLARDHSLPAIFIEKNGSVSAADILCRETGAQKETLDMAMAGDSYFDAMYHNIDTIKEALG